MNLRRIKKTLVLFIATCFVMTSFAFSQDDKDKYESKATKDERSKYSEDEKPDESYIAKFNARDVAERLIKKNIEQIYMLKVIISNFPEDAWRKDYKSIYDIYKKSLMLYYKRDMIYSQLNLVSNKKAINALYKNISDKYRSDTAKMLDICAESILTVSLNARTRSDPDRSQQLYQNLLRLRVAYGQMDESMNSYKRHNYQLSVFHLRLSKRYAIGIMEDLLQKEKIEKYKDSFSKEDYDRFMKLEGEKNKFRLPVHKADNLNRVLVKGSKSKAPK